MTTETQNPTDPRLKAKDSFWGRQLTDVKLDEAWHIAGILDREIHHSASFIKPLAKYAHIFADQEKIDASREEMILRDMYTERVGRSMNQTREALLENEHALQKSDGAEALGYARVIPTLIQQGETMPYYKAQDQAATSFARDHTISELGAKKMMAEAFERAEGRSLYEYGKELEKAHHAPVREAQREARKAERRNHARSGPTR